MKNALRLIVFVFMLSMISSSAQAQYQWEMGSILGIANYQGDFVEKQAPLFQESNFAFGVMGRYNLNYNWAIRGGLVVGKISGSDLNADKDGRKNRGGSFSNTLKEISFLMEWEPMGSKRYLSGAGFKRIISPYGFVGLGLVFMNPDVRFIDAASVGLEERVMQDANADYFDTRFVVPFGIGVKADLSEFWSLSFEVGMRYAFTDYLDGLSIAGNPDNNDWYNYSGVTVFYRLRNTPTTFVVKSK